MWTRTAALWALATAGLAGLITGLIAVIFVPGQYGFVEGRVNMVASVLPFFAVSLYLFVRCPRHIVARLLMMTASALCILTGLSGEISMLESSGRTVPLLWLQVLVLQWAHFAFAAGLAATFVAFPDDQIVDGLRRWTLRVLAALSLIGPVMIAVSRPTLFLGPALLRPKPTGTSPLFVPALSWLDPVSELAFQGAGVLYIVGIVGLLIRRDRATTEKERVQLKWMAAAGLVYALVLAAVTGAIELGALSPAFGAAAPCLVFFPIAISISVLRHQLLDVEVIIRKSALYGAITLVIGFAFAGLAATLGITAGDRAPLGVAIAVTAGLMLALQPLRHRLELLADRWVFGERVSGYEMLARFGGTLEHAYDLTELAPRLASTTVDGLQARWSRVSVCLTSGIDPILERMGFAGDEPGAGAEAALSVPLVHAGELVGLLECGPKREGLFDAEDHELLATLGRQAALAIHNARLAAELAGRIDEIRRQAGELRASRTRLVHAQDAERRRIERNIHDGAQQEIVALIAKLRLARNQLARSEDATADTTLAELQEDAKTLLGDLRELAHGIHPPVLADRGLFEALDARAARAELPVQIHADAGMRTTRFAEDVEGAAFFFVSEAMTNVFKHARARSIDVRLSMSGASIVVDVEDDGIGFVPADAQGHGLANMRDRIEALGGRLRVASSSGGGTRLRAELPISTEAEHAARSDR